MGPVDQRYQADAHRLRQMLSNLVGNAIKFTRQGRINIEGSELSRDGTSAMLEFSVRDTGIGIALDKLDLLFKPFSQTDSSTTREFGGTGLGLSIVRSLAHAIGGDVGVQSELGVGSRFWFRARVDIIAAGEDGRSAARHASTSAVPAQSPSQLNGSVLVVEDNAVNRMFVKTLLGKFGLRVSMAHDGQQGVDAVTSGEHFDIVLMDIHMPVMDGYVATERIRQWEVQGGHSHVPIIALTADAFEEDQRRCLATGMDDFITKPVAANALKSVLGKWLALAGKPALAAPDFAPLDCARFLTLADEVIPMLEQRQFNAIARFKRITALAAGTGIESEVREIGALLDSVCFELALERLRNLAMQTAEASAT
jgi:CheY-like chemotaxis protein